jgi:hypothetical protein
LMPCVIFSSDYLSRVINMVLSDFGPKNLNDIKIIK